MANVKSRLKAPKSASTKKKKNGHETKKSSTGPKKTPLKRNNTRVTPLKKKVISLQKNDAHVIPLRKNNTQEILLKKNDTWEIPLKKNGTPLKKKDTRVTPLNKNDTRATRLKKNDAQVTPLKKNDARVTPSKKNETRVTPSKKNDILDIPLKNNDTDCNVVMKRPSTRPVMTPDQKVQFLLKNGHTLKERFIAKPPVNVKQFHKPNIEQEGYYRKERDTNLPLMTKSGHLKKKKKSNMELLDILKNELMISDHTNTVNTDNAHPTEVPSLVASLTTMAPSQAVAVPPVRVGVDNNNDLEITDQNNTVQDYSDDDVCKLSDTISTKSDGFTDDEIWSDDTNENSIRKTSKKKNKLTPLKKKPRPKHITLKNGVVLKLEYYECDYCKKTFNRKGSLRRHMFVHLGIKPFKCLRCSQHFRSIYNLQIHVERCHMSSIDDPELFICNICEKPFLIKENLKKHLETHTNTESTFKCIYCSKVFAYHILLTQHEKKHMVKGRHQCTLCSMSYRCRNLLYLHVKSHLKIKDFICQYCGKEFLRPNSLKRHVEVSHGEHRITCPVCKKKLKGHLTEHMRTHEKKRPHVCPECGQRFTQSTQLTVHRRSHTGDRPYPCRICKRFFSHSNALMLHIRCHTGEKPFACAMCPMSFSQLPHMKTHMRSIHGKENPYKCANCDSFYKLKAELDVHEKACTAGITVNDKAKGKRKRSKKGEEEIEVESPMSLSRMRFLLALLLTMIATKEKLKYLGFNKRLVDEILVESLEAMDQTPCKDPTLPPAKRLKNNIEMFITGTVPKTQMDKFKKENKSTEDILELLTTEKDK